MWQCGSCEYWNDEWDETCRSCGIARISRDQPEQAAKVEQSGEAADTPPSAKTTVKRRRFGILEWVTVSVIVICVVVLGYLGYLYWSQGKLQLNLSLPVINRPLQDAGEENPGGFNSRKVAVETEHVLSAIYTSDIREVSVFVPYADTLIATEYAMKTIPDPATDQDGSVSPGLDQLKELTDHLLISVLEFEQTCQRSENPDIVSHEQLLRSVYSLRFDELLAVIGEFYILDDVGVHPAYLLSDEVPAAVEQYNPDLATRLIQRWSSVIFERSQRELDSAFEEEILELTSWVEAMSVLHRGFQLERSKVPPYGIRNGLIDKNTKQVLDLLAELLVDVESLSRGFEEYQLSIGDLGRSNRIKNLCRQFTQLAQTDHLYAFEEIYKIYSQDKALKYPVYEDLKGHYEFVLETWPNQDLVYRTVFSKYETEWVTRWVD